MMSSPTGMRLRIPITTSSAASPTRRRRGQGRWQLTDLDFDASSLEEGCHRIFRMCLGQRDFTERPAANGR
jgi:hypothetical protein